MLHDRCPACGAGVAFHRIELGRYGVIEEEPMTLCHECGFDLREAPVNAPVFYEDSSRQLMQEVLNMLEGGGGTKFDLGFFSVLHQMCKILLSNTKHIGLRRYVSDQVNTLDVPLQTGKVCYEERSIQERHRIIQLGMWLMNDPEHRVIDAWKKAKAVRYNVLKRDFHEMPGWYREVVLRCSNWRNVGK